MGSDPALATPDKGRELVMLAAQSLVRELDAFSRESMPG
jgi:creatinine amidohydrolase/Fe(II)-dependent formamide hydrolase-like protein